MNVANLRKLMADWPDSAPINRAEISLECGLQIKYVEPDWDKVRRVEIMQAGNRAGVADSECAEDEKQEN